MRQMNIEVRKRCVAENNRAPCFTTGPGTRERCVNLGEREAWR